ncbi:hypothetical protein T440DRAFT_114078 [Plenodomus tracheiphilus IPT5]|uniref:Uncharacterized protein n=1 Tax=Plenodomus tracheiphilus IPT5 TaxID=1408161 RepID=A0A6A7B3S2_9PLEO|nr:hypothetical protein T440DRAFT_114078 [Plenodomus tracheiphilus IPT5]
MGRRSSILATASVFLLSSLVHFLFLIPAFDLVICFLASVFVCQTSASQRPDQVFSYGYSISGRHACLAFQGKTGKKQPHGS